MSASTFVLAVSRLVVKVATPPIANICPFIDIPLMVQVMRLELHNISLRGIEQLHLTSSDRLALF